MIKISHPPRFLALFLIVAPDLNSCDAEVQIDDITCSYQGEQYRVGDSFDAEDGCNTCTCEADGFAACTAMGCITGCNYRGVSYSVGNSFPADDGCNTCTCSEDGSVLCTKMPCEVDGCTDNGQAYAVGEAFSADCGTCVCLDEGGIYCETECPAPTVCLYAGTKYDNGASFGAIDDCNSCTCGENGQIGCTEMACDCDPEEEWYRQYVGLGDECELIDFGCSGNTTPFANECGCGCQQNVACPEYFDCIPLAPCDETALLELCPYSQLAY